MRVYFKDDGGILASEFVGLKKYLVSYKAAIG